METQPLINNNSNNNNSNSRFPEAEIVHHSDANLGATNASNYVEAGGVVGVPSSTSQTQQQRQKLQEQQKRVSSNKNSTCRKCSICTCSSIAIFLLIIGILLITWLPGFINDQITEKLSLAKPTTMLWSGFRNQSHEVTVRFIYNFFNVTNWREVEHEGAKPNLTVAGPYSYIRIKWRDEAHVYWDADGVLHYKTQDYFKFDPSTSGPGLTEDDWVMTPRAGLFIALQRTGGNDLFVTVLSELEKWESIDSFFTNRTIRELFHGYNDTFLEQFAEFGIDPLVAFGAATPNLADAKPSAIYSGMKKSDTVETPESKRHIPRTIGQYYQWQGYDTLPWWDSEYANMINGSDGSMFPPNLFNTKQMYIWVDNLKRSLLGEHTSNVDFHGINLQRYTLQDKSLAAASVNPDNYAFYISETGLQPIPPVKNHDSRYILSVLGKPFYLDCNTSGVNVTLPRKAIRSIDDSHLDIEPHSGVLLRVKNQLQASIGLHPMIFYNVFNKSNHTIGPTKHFPKTWLPVFTASEEYQMGETLRNKISFEIILPLTLAKYLGPTLVAVSGLIGSAMLIRECICTKGQGTDV